LDNFSVPKRDRFVLVLCDEPLHIEGQFIVEWGLWILRKHSAIELDRIRHIELFDKIEADAVHQTGRKTGIGNERYPCILSF
jgi:hypothetical protein